MPVKIFAVGDRVKFSAAWCNSTSQHTGPIPFARGKILNIKQYSPSFGIATIEWENDIADEIPTKVNTRNLEPA